MEVHECGQGCVRTGSGVPENSPQSVSGVKRSKDGGVQEGRKEEKRGLQREGSEHGRSLKSWLRI